MSSSSQDPISTWRPVALFSSKNRSNQQTLSDRERFLQDINLDSVLANVKFSWVHCNVSYLRTMKPWLKWSSKAEVQQSDMYSELIELLLTGCLTELIFTPRFKSSMSTPNTNLQTYWPKGISHVMSETIFFICLTSAFSGHFAALRIAAWPAALNDGEKDARTGRRRQDRGKVKADDEPGLHCLDKFFDCAESCCVENPEDTQSTLSKRLVKYRETWRKRIQSRRSVEFSRMAKRCSSGCRYEEIRRDRRRPGTPEFPWRFNKYTRRFRKTQKPKAVTKFGPTISIYQQIVCCTWRRFSRSWDKDMVSSRQIKWRTSISTQLFGVYFYLSLFKLQFILVKITQKKCDLPGINPRNLWDSYFKWLRGWSLTRLKLLVLQRLIGSSLCGERDDSAYWQSCSVCNCQDLRLLWISAESKRYQYWTGQSLGKEE